MTDVCLGRYWAALRTITSSLFTAYNGKRRD